MMDKKSSRLKLLLAFLVMAGGILGIIFSEDGRMFYNALIVPIIGGTAYILLKKKISWFLAGMTLVVFLWVAIREIMDGFLTYASPFELVSMSLCWSGIFMLLGGLGMAIVYLLQHAFEKETAGRRSLVGKIAAGTTGISLIVALLLFVNSFVGNPLSGYLATKAAKPYIQLKYPAEQLKIIRSAYNFKDGHYMVFVQSSVSQDTAFSIQVDSFGKVVGDDYLYEVTSRLTTMRRLESELREIAKTAVEKNAHYDFENVFLAFPKDKEISNLQLDTKLDVYHPPMPLELDVTLYDQEVTYDKIAEVARTLEFIVKKKALPVQAYSIRIIPLNDKPTSKNKGGSWANSVAVSSFPAQRLSEPALGQAMAQYEKERTEAVNQGKKE